MLIYRLETAVQNFPDNECHRFESVGTGVYRSNALYDCKNTYSGNRNKHPAPYDDSLFESNCKKKFGPSSSMFHFSGRYVFGFSSPAQLLRWFYNLDDLKALEDGGIIVAVYDCDDVIEGNTQVAFNEWHHQLFNPVEVYSPSDFYSKFGQGS